MLSPCLVAKWLERRAIYHVYAPVEQVRNLPRADTHEMPLGHVEKITYMYETTMLQTALRI